MKPDQSDNPMLSAAARMLELTRRTVLEQPGHEQPGREPTGNEHAGRDPAAVSSAPRARRASGQTRRPGRRERIG